MKQRWTGWIGIGAVIWVFGFVWVEAASAQTRYTIDDVMDKLVEMDKRLVRVETEIGYLKDRVEHIENVRLKELEISLLTRMKETETSLLAQINKNTTTIWTVFGALITLYVTILLIVLGIYKNVRPRHQERPVEVGVPKEDWAVTLEKLLEPLRKEIREIAAREERLEKQVLVQTA